MCTVFYYFYVYFRTEQGTHLPPAVSVGDRVLLPEFGGAKVRYLMAFGLATACFPGKSN
jgi:hypothetical protein